MIDTVLAIKSASKSQHPKHRHAALVFKNDELIVVTTNDHHWHAEARAIEVAKLLHASEDRSGSTIGRGLSLVSIAIDKAGRLKLARPCPSCQWKLEQNGIKNVYYSTKDQRIVRMK